MIFLVFCWSVFHFLRESLIFGVFLLHRLKTGTQGWKCSFHFRNSLRPRFIQTYVAAATAASTTDSRSHLLTWFVCYVCTRVPVIHLFLCLWRKRAEKASAITYTGVAWPFSSSPHLSVTTDLSTVSVLWLAFRGKELRSDWLVDHKKRDGTFRC